MVTVRSLWQQGSQKQAQSTLHAPCDNSKHLFWDLSILSSMA